MLRKIITLCLWLETDLILKRFKPKIIAITGTVGKSSAKEALFSVLSRRYRIERSYASYNTPIGVPLTIINTRVANRSITRWLEILYKGFKRLISNKQDFPTHFIVEMGADKKGDIAELTSRCQPFASVLTAITPVHLETFRTIEEIAREKRIIIEVLNANGWACLNADDSRVMSERKVTKAKVITYAINNVHADVRATDIKYICDERGIRTMFKVVTQGSVVPVELVNVIGYPMIYSALVGVCAGLMEGMNLLEIAKGLKAFVPPPGRLHVLPGIKRTWIVDDSYNASPQAVMQALDAFYQLPLVKTRRIVVIGDMAELGVQSQKFHDDMGKYLFERKPDMIIAVGPFVVVTVRRLRELGYPEDSIHHFDTAEMAKKFVQEVLKEGDWVLIKGSQVIRLEKVVKEIMAEPLRANELLCRQEDYWQSNTVVK